MVKIAGSFLKIQNEVSKIKKLNEVCDLIHFDIMDGKFTERPTLPISDMAFLKELNKPIDIHLMTLDNKKYIEKVISFNPSYITFHIESSKNPEEDINLIHNFGIKAGIALNPNTPIDKIYPYLNSIDMVLVMSVEAGAGGQKFIDITSKIDELIKIKDEKGFKYLIEVDGGINDETIKQVKNADIVVAGSFITNADNYQAQVYKLKKSLRNGFTLAELLGVIVVLSILGLVAVTTIGNSIKKSRYDSCKAQEVNLTEGAKMLLIDYPNLLPTSSSPLTINARQLQDGGTINGQTIPSGYIEDNLINPMTEKTYVSSASGVSVRVTTSNGKNFEYTVVYGNNNEACHR